MRPTGHGVHRHDEEDGLTNLIELMAGFGSIFGMLFDMFFRYSLSNLKWKQGKSYIRPAMVGCIVGDS